MPPISLKPYWQTADSATVRLYRGHVLDVLGRLPARSAQCVITSPPYWGMRDYETGTWEGGDPGCGHSRGRGRGVTCVKCGAARVEDHQLGSEVVPDCGQLLRAGPGLYRKSNCAERDWATGCHVCHMVLVFREVRRVLRDDGTLWLNYGDGYSPGGNLVGVPWRVALALQSDGWVLRQDVIWHKPSPMPESVRDRCTKAHEYVFLLVKKAGYFCDMEAIKDDSRSPAGMSWEERKKIGSAGLKNEGVSHRHDADRAYSSRVGDGNLSNKRSVWAVPPYSYSGAHFATFPPKLITPMIRAGTSAKGACASCGAPWERLTEERAVRRERPNDYVKRTGEEGTGNSCPNTAAGVEVKTVGWRPTCECHGRFERRTVKRIVRVGGGPEEWEKKQVTPGGRPMSNRSTMYGPENHRAARGEYQEVEEVVRLYVPGIPPEEHPVRPCVVLDPFVGSGTTAVVCVGEGRRCVGVDLNEGYLRDHAVPRVKGALTARPATAGLTGFKAVRVEAGDELGDVGE
jgi:DNA modification methylase